MPRLASIFFAVCLLGSAHAQTASAPAAAGASQGMTISRSGTRPTSPGPGQFFTGTARVEPLFPVNAPSRMSGASVTFEPGARSNWHTHPLGQVLIVTAGQGRAQEWGKPVQELRPGDVLWCPPGVKHWHGASPTSSLTHIALQETLDGRNVEWLEKVSDEQYALAQAPAAAASQPQASTPTQRLFGDFAPKFVELNDNLLFGDIWERPGLSKRDRSLVTVATLVALNRPEYLPFHLQNARRNGVSQEELIEAITHLAFYAGWPSGYRAMTVAKDVFAPAAPTQAPAR